MRLRNNELRLGNISYERIDVGSLPNQRCTVQSTTTLRSHNTQSNRKIVWWRQTRIRLIDIFSRVITFNYAWIRPHHVDLLLRFPTIFQQRKRPTVQFDSGSTWKEATMANCSSVIDTKSVTTSLVWSVPHRSPVQRILCNAHGNVSTFLSVPFSVNRPRFETKKSSWPLHRSSLVFFSSSLVLLPVPNAMRSLLSTIFRLHHRAKSTTVQHQCQPWRPRRTHLHPPQRRQRRVDRRRRAQQQQQRRVDKRHPPRRQPPDKRRPQQRGQDKRPQRQLLDKQRRRPRPQDRQRRRHRAVLRVSLERMNPWRNQRFDAWFDY